MIAIGKRAPAFHLPDQDGTLVRLSALAGRWVVLFFYPRDDTPGCTTENQEFTALAPWFRRHDVELLGCSPDSAEKHCRFIHKHALKTRLLTDADHAVMEAYGAWGEKKLYGKTSMGVIRSTVLIDPSGKVVAHWPKVKAKGHAEEVRDTLVELMG